MTTSGSINGSVGRGGRNIPTDVKIIQQLLNAKIPVPLPLLAETGFCDDQMILTIETYQRRNVPAVRPDGRIDPGGATFRSLTGQGAASSSSSSSSSGSPGKLYTDNPNEVATTRTTPTAREVVHMLLAAWPELNEQGARTLTAQFMGETGDGKYCFNWNLGNVKASASQKHMYLANVWECASADTAPSMVEKAGGLAHIADDAEAKKHGWACPSVIVVFQPPHAQCRFRAYGSLQEGAARWVDHHKKIASKNADYITLLNDGDVEGAAKALKAAKYYTAGEAKYAAIMKQKKKVIDDQLGPIQQ